MKRTVFSLVTIGLFLFTASLVAQTRQPTNEEFTWSAELVALDDMTRVVTVKAPTVSESAFAEFGPLKAGERITLKWSGYDKSADSISSAMRSAVVVKAGERFTFPVEFVAADATRRYITFKVQIPEHSIANLKALKPGDWVTATSPQGAALSKTTPVVTIRPYVTTATTPTAG
jgi:hypothetical protein